MHNQKKPAIRKLGTIKSDIVETTPVVFKDRLYRFEYMRDKSDQNLLGKPYFHFIDVEKNEPTPAFATDFHLGSAFVDDKTDLVYAFGVPIWGADKLYVFWSSDMVNWSSRVALDLPGWGIFNTSVCFDQEKYVMAFEIDAPPEETGVRFTIRFAISDNLKDWTLTPSACVFSHDRYTACPALRFFNGKYYMAYLEAKPGPEYEVYLVRSTDLISWQASPHMPFLRHSAEDKQLYSDQFTAAEKERISQAVNINNSDPDFCQWQDKTVIYYSWGDQQGVEHLAEAVYEGPLVELLEGFFTE